MKEYKKNVKGDGRTIPIPSSYFTLLLKEKNNKISTGNMGMEGKKKNK